MDLVHLGGLRSENTSHLEHYNLFFFLLQCLILAEKQQLKPEMNCLINLASLVAQVSMSTIFDQSYGLRAVLCRKKSTFRKI